MSQSGWGVFTINDAGRKVWVHPKAGDRLCFLSKKAAINYGRLAFPNENLWVVDPDGQEQEITDD